jgi:hypothetical protein
MARRGGRVPVMIKPRAITVVLIGFILAACAPRTPIPARNHSHSSEHKTKIQNQAVSLTPTLPASPPIKPLTSGPPEGDRTPKDDKWIDPPEVVR